MDRAPLGVEVLPPVRGEIDAQKRTLTLYQRAPLAIHESSVIVTFASLKEVVAQIILNEALQEQGKVPVAAAPNGGSGIHSAAPGLKEQA